MKRVKKKRTIHLSRKVEPPFSRAFGSPNLVEGVKVFMFTRCVIGCHLFAVAYCTGFSLADHGRLENVFLANAYESRLAAFVFLGCMLAWFLYPVAMQVAIAHKYVPENEARYGSTLEFLLCIAQACAIFPLCM